MKNRNHPKKGDNLTVEPIREMRDIQSIKRLLSYKPRDLLLFTLSVNSGLRMTDILDLKVGQLRNLKVGDYVFIREKKTQKNNLLVINKPIYKVLKDYLKKNKPNDNEYLFPSQKGDKPLTIPSVNRMVKNWCHSINLKGKYGVRTLRKTFGTLQRKQFGVGFDVLCERYNHSSPRVTMRYLGITREDVTSILMNEI